MRIFRETRSKFACDQCFELIQPGKGPLDGEPLLYESCHALLSAIGSNFYNRKSRAPPGSRERFKCC